MKKILLAGGTGFIGNHLIAYFTAAGYEISILTRKKKANTRQVKYFYWDLEEGIIEDNAFEMVETIINLTGANIFTKRWTKSRKKKIINSRVAAINLLHRYVSENQLPVKNFISSSAIGYYGAVSTDQIFTEKSENGNDFLSSVCQKWEKAAHQFEELNCRVLILRQGMVLGKHGGAFQKMTSLVKLGLNPAVGSGDQYIPWLDIRDLTRLYLFCSENHLLSGVFNAVSSEQITMNHLSKQLQISLGKKYILPNAPAFIIKLLLGERSSMILKGSRVSNNKIKETGFEFLYDNLDSALQ